MAKSARRTSVAPKYRTIRTSAKSVVSSLGSNPKGYGVIKVKDRRGRLKGYRAW